MDYILDIILPEKELYKLNIQEFLFEWDGERYSQDPPVYRDDKGLEFRQIQDLGYYKSFLKKFQESGFNRNGLISLTLCGEYLSALEYLINRKAQNEAADQLLRFLEKLYEIENFAVFLIRDEEVIDKRYQVSTREEFLKVFCNCLNWELPKGAFITKKPLRRRLFRYK